jgi:hypothetical protein
MHLEYILNISGIVSIYPEYYHNISWDMFGIYLKYIRSISGKYPGIYLEYM